MSRPIPRLVVFDLAGTTMQDDGTVASVFQQVLSAEGLSSTPEEIARLRGASKREAFQKLAGDPERAGRMFDAFIAALHQRFASTPPREVRGASAVFAWLHEQGVKVALNTGFERETVEALIAALGWNSTVLDAIVCGDDVPMGRPAPAMIQEAMLRTGVADPSTVMAVGDTVLDLQAGMAAHAGWIIGVTSGAHDHATLLQAPHTHLVASIAGIRELLR